MKDNFFISLTIFKRYNIIYRKTEKEKKERRSYEDEKIALKKGDNK